MVNPPSRWSFCLMFGIPVLILLSLFVLWFGLLCTDSVNFLSSTRHCCPDSRNRLGGKVGGPERGVQHFLKLLATNANYVLFANARAFVHPSFQANKALYCTLFQPWSSRWGSSDGDCNSNSWHCTPALHGGVFARRAPSARLLY
jgi:hypothetical protein